MQTYKELISILSTIHANVALCMQRIQHIFWGNMLSSHYCHKMLRNMLLIAIKVWAYFLPDSIE
jgi:hypothetical protein